MSKLKNYYRKIDRSYMKKSFVEWYAKKHKYSISWIYKKLSYGELKEQYENFINKER